MITQNGSLIAGEVSIPSVPVSSWDPIKHMHTRYNGTINRYSLLIINTKQHSYLTTLQVEQGCTSYQYFRLEVQPTSVLQLRAITDDPEQQCFIAFDAKGLPVEDACAVSSSPIESHLYLKLMSK